MWYEFRIEGYTYLLNLDSITYVWYDYKNEKMNVFGHTSSGTTFKVPYSEYLKLKDALEANGTSVQQQLNKLKKEAENLRTRIEGLVQDVRGPI